MTVVVVISIALLLGAGLVVSQLVRLKEWLGKAPPPDPGPTEPPG
ncbi:hypothetical protein [Mycolicibacterium hodleri]|nr:hypothetical protein [Mycolicibacterium hodleri]